MGTIVDGVLDKDAYGDVGADCSDSQYIFEENH